MYPIGQGCGRLVFRHAQEPFAPGGEEMALHTGMGEYVYVIVGKSARPSPGRAVACRRFRNYAMSRCCSARINRSTPIP